MFWAVLITNQLLHMYVLDPLFKKKKRIPMDWIRAGAIVMGVMAFTVAYDMRETPESLFSLLNVRRDASRQELKKAFKDVSIIYHPDKNPGPEGEQRFMAARDAYELLQDEGLRRIYDRFGVTLKDPSAVRDFSNFGNLFFLYFTFFGPAMFLAFCFTRGRRRAGAFMVTLVVLSGILLAEIFLRHSDVDYDLLVWILPHMTIHTKITIMHTLFLSCLGIIASVSEFFFEDREEEMRMLLEVIYGKLEELLPDEVGTKEEGKSGEEHKKKFFQMAEARKAKMKQRMQAAVERPAEGYRINWLQMIFFGIVLYNALFAK